MNWNPAINLAELELADCGAWPAPLRALCLAAVAALILGGGHALLLAGQRAELTAERQRAQQVQAQVLRKRVQAGQRDAAAQRLEQATADLAAQAARLPTAEELSLLIEAIGAAAVASGLGIERIELGGERSADFHAQVPIALELRGRYHAFGTFAAAVAALPQLVALHDVGISRTEADLRLTATASTYRYTGRADALPPAAPAADNAPAYRATGMRSPFAAHPGGTAPPVPDTLGAVGTFGNETALLAEFPLAQLRMAGSLSGRGVLHALVEAPDGYVQRIAAGDVLGAERARVTAVDAAGVTLLDNGTLALRDIAAAPSTPSTPTTSAASEESP